MLKGLTTGNSPNLAEATQIQEDYQTTSRKYPKKSTPKHILSNLWKLKTKKKMLKTAREKHDLMYKGKKKFWQASFSSETMVARMKGTKFLMAERKNC